MFFAKGDCCGALGAFVVDEYAVYVEKDHRKSFRPVAAIAKGGVAIDSNRRMILAMRIG